MIPRRSIEVVTAPTTYPATVPELKAFSRVTGSDDDAMLETMLAAATASVENYLNRKIITQSLRLHMDSFGGFNDEKLLALGAGTHDGFKGDFVGGVDFIDLPFGFVQSVTSIKTFNEYNTESTLDSATYRVDSYGARVYLNSGYTWPSALRNLDAIHVLYVAGYGAASAVPAPIKQSVLMAARQMYECGGQCDLSPACKAMLNGYRILDGMGW
jgi:hypothetical protein